MADGDALPTPVPDTELAGLGGAVYFPTIQVGAGEYLQGADEDDNTVLVRLNAPNGPRAGLTVPGYVYNVVRVR